MVCSFLQNCRGYLVMCCKQLVVLRTHFLKVFGKFANELVKLFRQSLYCQLLLLWMHACLLLHYCSYPMQPPVVRFVTKVFHPNISRHGDVGLDSIHHNWSLALTISKVLLSIQSLLTDPYWYVCMEPAVGQMYRDNISEFNRTARLWTWKYAMHDYLQPFSHSIIPNTLCTVWNFLA